MPSASCGTPPRTCAGLPFRRPGRNSARATSFPKPPVPWHSEALGDAIDLDAIPPLPERAIAYIDGYGNLKTTWPANDLPASSGTALRLRIGEREHNIVVS